MRNCQAFSLNYSRRKSRCSNSVPAPRRSGKDSIRIHLIFPQEPHVRRKPLTSDSQAQFGRFQFQDSRSKGKTDTGRKEGAFLPISILPLEHPPATLRCTLGISSFLCVYGNQSLGKRIHLWLKQLREDWWPRNKICERPANLWCSPLIRIQITFGVTSQKVTALGMDMKLFPGSWEKRQYVPLLKLCAKCPCCFIVLPMTRKQARGWIDR